MGFADAAATLDSGTLVRIKSKPMARIGKCLVGEAKQWPYIQLLYNFSRRKTRSRDGTSTPEGSGKGLRLPTAARGFQLRIRGANYLKKPTASPMMNVTEE